MKTLIKQFWTEPAIALHALNGVLQVTQILLVNNTTVSAILAAVGAAFFGNVTRNRVKAVRP